jgi:adenylate cyclase
MGEKANAKVTYDSARLALEEMVQESPENPFHHASLGQAYAGLGNREKALEYGIRAVEMHPIQTDPYSSGENLLLMLAQIHIVLGDFDEALDHLETLLSIPSQVTPWRLKLDPMYDPIRDHPRFEKFIDK